MILSWSSDAAIAELRAKERYELADLLEEIRKKNFLKDAEYANKLFRQLEIEVKYYRNEFLKSKSWNWRSANIKLFPILCILSVLEYWYTGIGNKSDIYNDAFNLDKDTMESHIDCFQELSLKLLSGLFFVDHSEDIYISLGNSVGLQHYARIAYNTTVLLKIIQDDVETLSSFEQEDDDECESDEDDGYDEFDEE